ncbi:MAG: hypothetical protein IKZ51_00430 [Bacteroidales bacterium]|nr:hypothetical protein [Bacteroidales bacterium]
MKKCLLLIVIVLFAGCSDTWKLEQSYKSLSGSVASVYEHIVEGTLDGDALPFSSEDGVCILVISSHSRDSISLYFKFSSTFCPYEDIVSISTTPFVLSGQPASVQFDDNITLLFTKYNNQNFKEIANIKGWINNETLIQLWTKTQPVPFEYKCDILISWGESQSLPEVHCLQINNILRYPPFR